MIVGKYDSRRIDNHARAYAHGRGNRPAKSETGRKFFIVEKILKGSALERIFSLYLIRRSFQAFCLGFASDLHYRGNNLMRGGPKRPGQTFSLGRTLLLLSPRRLVCAAASGNKHSHEKQSDKPI